MTALSTLFQEVENICRPGRCTGVSISEKEESFVLEACVAGVKPKDISITLENGSIQIEAKTDKYAYSYLIPVAPHQIDETAISAESQDGILQLTLPKSKSAKAQKITVKSA